MVALHALQAAHQIRQDEWCPATSEKYGLSYKL